MTFFILVIKLHQQTTDVPTLVSRRLLWKARNVRALGTNHNIEIKQPVVCTLKKQKYYARYQNISER